MVAKKIIAPKTVSRLHQHVIEKKNVDAIKLVLTLHTAMLANQYTNPSPKKHNTYYLTPSKLSY